MIEEKFKLIGLSLNALKCEVTVLETGQEAVRGVALETIRNVIPDIASTPLEQLSLLGSPISDGGLEHSLEAGRRKVEVFCGRVGKLDAHTALFFLVHFASAPRLQYLLRTSPVYLRTG